MTIIKIPFELGNVDPKRRGTAEAPAAISKLVNADFRDVEVSSDFEQTQNNVIEAAKALYKKQSRCIAIGGDHSITYGLTKAFRESFEGALGLIYIDAHLDAEDNFLPPSHEDVIPAIVNENIISSKNILILGARKLYPKEVEFARKHNLAYSKQIDYQQVQSLLNRCDAIYISLDIDAIDPKFAPGTGYPEPEGLKEELLDFLQELANSPKVKGFDLVEVCPRLDKENRTVKLAAKLISLFATPKD